MASETGHAKNVANFETLISIVQSYGAVYNPPRANLKLPALTPMPGTARDMLSEVNHFLNLQTVATNEREAAFEGLGKLVTRVIGALEISDADAAIGDRARTLARKIKGGRAGDKPVDDPATPDIDESQTARSVSQLSYDNQLANFEGLVQLLESQASYAPNETDLKAATLRARADTMRAGNTAAMQAQTALDAARSRRNDILYKENTGLVDIASDVKKYVKSAFGADSPQYGQIKGLEIRKPR
jgi:hypothetical protein